MIIYADNCGRWQPTRPQIIKSSRALGAPRAVLGEGGNTNQKLTTKTTEVKTTVVPVKLLECPVRIGPTARSPSVQKAERA